MRMQQHLNFIEEAAPKRLVRAERQQVIDASVCNFAEQGVFAAGIVLTRISRIGSQRQEYQFLTTCCKMPVKHAGELLGLL